ncbi:AraC family transcriptional regulator N-terminal domain-containing protein [Sinorhizobium sp. GL28]|nr:hypothetical protein N184_21510 [Sinorhizobium sp. GL28]
MLPSVVLVSSCVPTLPAGEITGPMFALVAQGAKHICLGDRVASYRPG